MDNTTQTIAGNTGPSVVKIIGPLFAPIYSNWPDEHYEYLKMCWADGCSAAITARNLNEKFGASYTRNAIIGKVSRGGLSLALGRQKYFQPTIKDARRVGFRRKHHAEAPQPIPTIDDTQIPLEQRKSLLELGPKHCRWPVGHPTDAGFFFCGGKSLDTSPYCSGHHQLAFVPLRRASNKPTQAQNGRTDYSLPTFG